MEEYPWMDRIGSIQAGIDLLSDLGWNINIIQHDSSWFVRSGEKPIFHTDDRTAIDTFLYGMALSYSVVPETILDQFRREIAD